MLRKKEERKILCAGKAIEVSSWHGDALFRRFMFWERIWATEMLGFNYKLQWGYVVRIGTDKIIFCYQILAGRVTVRGKHRLKLSGDEDDN